MILRGNSRPTSAPQIMPRIAILWRPTEHMSLAIYRDHVVPRLQQLGFTFCPFAPGDPTPADCDAVWDPGLGMRSVPDNILASSLPVVVTVLGLRAFALPAAAYTLSAAEAASENSCKVQLTSQWQYVRPRLAAAITISHVCAQNLVAGLHVPAARVHVAHLGVDQTAFCPRPRQAIGGGDYLLHVSSADTGRKNVQRLLEAYAALPLQRRTPLFLKLPTAPADLPLPPGAHIITGHLPTAELAVLYQQALGFLFPSIYEGFGLPLVEAMACGCPIITSTGGACAEVVGDAALIVDPANTADLASAIQRLLADHTLRQNLATRGLDRVKRFTWEACAERHADILRRVLAPHLSVSPS